MNDPLTHAYAHLLAESHLAVFAPAFTFSLCESEAPANRRMRIASVVRLRKNLRFAFQKPCLIMYEK